MEVKLAVNEAFYTIDHVTTNLVKGRLNSHVSWHKHPVYHILYFLEGRGKVGIGSTTTAAKPGMLYVISPNVNHRFLFGDGEPLTNLECTFRLLDARGEAAEVDFFDIAATGKSPVAIPKPDRQQPFAVPARLKPFLMEGFMRILDLNDSPLLRHHYDLAVADLIARVEKAIRGSIREDREDEPALEMIETVKHFLYTNRHRSVTLRETADAAHVTPNYLCKIFKRHTGESPMGYLQALRMGEAEKLLSFTDLPVYAIAEKLGYEEASYFARVFRGVYGESPQSYRKRLVQENRIISCASRPR